MAGTRSSAARFGIEFEFEYDVDVTRLTLHGELDALSVPAFAAVSAALVERGVRSVSIDLTDLRLFFAIAKTAPAFGGNDIDLARDQAPAGDALRRHDVGVDKP